MAKSIRCPCEKNPKCQLCAGKGDYPYEPGPNGWQPFPCPTCRGAGKSEDGEPCLTCHGERRIDPANPPMRGLFDLLWKTFFGA